MSIVVPLNVNFLLILQWISNEFQANVLTFWENWCSQAKRGKREQKDDLLRRRGASEWVKWHHGQLAWPARREGVAGNGRGGFYRPAAPALPPRASTEGLSPWEKAPGVASNSLPCPAQAFWVLGPDRLSPPYHLQPSRSLGIKKWTHCVAPYLFLTLVHLCLHSRLHGSG